MTDKEKTLKRYRSHLRAIPSDKVTSYQIKVSAWINHCQEVAVNQADTLFDEFIELMDNRLNDDIDKATTNQNTIIALDSLREFRKNTDKLKLHFGDQINHGFDLFKRKSLATYLREPHPEDKMWSLIDNDELEENIAIKTIAHESNIKFSEELWQLEKRFGSINGGETVNEHNNPTAPLQFCIALRSTLNIVPINNQSRLTAYKVFASIIYKYLEPLYSTTNDFFISEGILPNLRFEKGLTESTYNVEKSIAENPYLKSAPSNSTDQDADDGIYNDRPIKDGDQIQLVYAIRAFLQQKHQYDAPTALDSRDREQPTHTPSPNHPPVLFINQQIIDAVDKVQSTKGCLLDDSNPTLDTQSVTRANQQIADTLSQQSPHGKVNPKDMYTIDLVGILFEYILTDDNLPDAIKALLGHLHTPFLKLAFIDTDFFEKPEHPARLLLDSLAEAGTNWVDQQGHAQYDMYSEIKRVVMRIMEEFKNDVRLFADVLFEFNRLKNKLTHKHQLKERNTVERLQGQERLRLAKERAKREIESRTKDIKLPAAVVQLLKPWYTYLTLLQLRDNENEARWRQALRVIDEVTYFFNFKNDSVDRQALEPRFKGILTAIKIGFTTLGYDQNKTKKILIDLTALKIATIKKYVGTPKTAQPETITTAPPQAIKPTAFTAQEPKPMLPREDTPNAEEAKVINYLKLIEPGTWFEFEDKLRLKVSGFSPKLLKYMLVDGASQKVVMISRLEFARKIILGKVRIVTGSSKPLFERALESIFRHLDQEVKSNEK
ncbi:MAG: DUF1631 domain-containing protein [Cellvibrionaceae bacterium]|nr:DUF1631 domain-containing protein [Cellvibrionaceae bacterium]